MQRNATNSSSDRLFKLIEIARPRKKNQKTKIVAETIIRPGNSTKSFAKRPIGFIESLLTKKKLVSGDNHSFGIVFFEGDAVLHNVNTATRLSGATFLYKNEATYMQSAERIWLAIFMMWSFVHSGYSYWSHTDHGFSYISGCWKLLTDLMEFCFRLAGIEAHSSFKVGEGYHGLLRKTCWKTKYRHPFITSKYL